MSQETYLRSLSANERLTFLQNNAHSADEGKYSRAISDEEKTLSRELHVDNSIRLSDLKETFDEVKKQYKKDIEPFETVNKVLLNEIRTGYRLCTGTQYRLANHDSGWMETYNEDGNLISTRRLRPDEKQGGLFPMLKVN